MVDEQTGLEVPPEIAAATLEIEKCARSTVGTSLYCAPSDLPDVVPGQCQRCGEHADKAAEPPAPMPFEEFERRIKLLRENGVRSYRDPYMQVQIDTYKRQPDPTPASETFST